MLEKFLKAIEHREELLVEAWWAGETPTSVDEAPESVRPHYRMFVEWAQYYKKAPHLREVLFWIPDMARRNLPAEAAEAEFYLRRAGVGASWSADGKGFYRCGYNPIESSVGTFWVRSGAICEAAVLPLLEFRDQMKDLSYMAAQATDGNRAAFDSLLPALNLAVARARAIVPFVYDRTAIQLVAVSIEPSTHLLQLLLPQLEGWGMTFGEFCQRINDNMF